MTGTVCTPLFSLLIGVKGCSEPELVSGLGIYLGIESCPLERRVRCNLVHMTHESALLSDSVTHILSGNGSAL